jgi:hypothetical protein
MFNEGGYMKIKCPKCGEEVWWEPVSIIPDEQKIIMVIKKEGSGQIQAQTLGNVIKNTAKIFETSARANGVKVVVFVIGCQFDEGEVKVTYAVIRQKKGGK